MKLFCTSRSNSDTVNECRVYFGFKVKELEGGQLKRRKDFFYKECIFQ